MSSETALESTSRRLDLASRFRANPKWQLRLLDKVDARTRRAFGDELPAETYGFLYEADRSGGLKAVGPDTALLFITLQEPSPLPQYIKASFGEETEDAVAALIADDVLEVEIGGEWRSGAEALLDLRGGGQAPGVGEMSPTYERSMTAIKVASALPTSDQRSLASFIYRYGATPTIPERARRWSTASNIFEDLRLGEFPNPLVLSSDEAWWTFYGSAANGDEDLCKLYVGVQVDAVEAALNLMRELWNDFNESAPPFKLGASSEGLHRPDRIVIYPGDFERAALWADRLLEKIASLPADPVPFTGAWKGSGCLSIGSDPKGGSDSWQSSDSWRSYLADKLASALLSAKKANSPRPWEVALNRLSIEGVDTQTFAPAGKGWSL